MQNDSPLPTMPLSPVNFCTMLVFVFNFFLLLNFKGGQVDDKKEKKLGSADLECKERMPTPDIIYIPCPYPWKRTYCGSELVYDPAMCDSENDGGEQSGDEGAAAIKSEPVSPVKESSSLALEDADYVFVNRCVPKPEERGAQQEGSASSPDYKAISPAPAPVPPCDEVGMERVLSESFEVGRTGSDADERTGSVAVGSGYKTPDAYTVPDVKIKLERFSPRHGKAAVREDSVPLDEEPRKRVRFESPVAETCQA